jgi:hypothetical protein
MRPLLLLLPLLLLPLGGCENSCPYVKTLDSSAEAPGLIQMLLSVQCAGEPVTDLAEADVTVREDGEEASRSEAAWILQDVTAELDVFSLLLMDVSASVVAEGTLETAREVATEFARSLTEQDIAVSVAIFDGDPEIRTIVEFTTNADTLAAGIAGIDEGDQRDPSTNLNGAILLALEQLDAVVEPDVEAELESVANLVIFTDGVDRAQRETDAAARQAVNATEHDVFLVALTGEADEAAELAELGPSGFFQANAASDLFAAFDELTASLVAETDKYYTLAYCSPLRARRHTLEIEVVLEEGSGKVKFSYSADGFGPGCELPGG